MGFYKHLLIPTGMLALALCSTAYASMPKLYTVTAQPVTQTLYYNGQISPLQNVPVISPTAGTVDQLFFSYGQRISKGQPLLHVQSQKTLDALRSAEAAYLTALDDFQKKQNWQTSSTFLTAQASLMRAKRTLSQAQLTYQENQHLYQLQIISKDELVQSENAYQDSQSSLAEAQYTFDNLVTQAKGDDLTVATLRFKNAQEKYDSLKAQVAHATIVAPASGVILQPEANSNTTDSTSKTAGKIQVGTSISYQQMLLTIGDTSGLNISLAVPETNIDQIHQGQTAIITGAGFPGITLHGTVTEVAAQATPGSGGGGIPTFPVEVKVTEVTPAQSQQIRVGMDAQVAITVYHSDNTLTVPIHAVAQNAQHQSYVNVYDPTTHKTTPTVITTGKVTMDSVQVQSGLQAGQEIVLP